MAASTQQLFDCFLHVCLVQGEEGLAPNVKSQYPKTANAANFQSIVQFCFPDVDMIRPESKMKSATFSFVLTETSGERRFGYCRRLLPKGGGKRLPECFCITSFFPCFSVFNSILDEVESRSTFPSFSAVTFFLEAIWTKQLPDPGQALTVHVCSWDHPGQVDQHSFQRPSDNDSLLDHVRLEPLLCALEPHNLLLLYGSLLVERRVIFVSQSLPVLSACVQAAVALLYPFTWQHIYIPVLPASLLNFCCAPMPFVVGVLESSLDALSELPLDETLIVDLDENRFLRYPNPDNTLEDYERLDDIGLALVHRVLSDSRLLCAKKAKRKELSAAAKERLTTGFLRFIISQIAHFQDFVSRGPDGSHEIDKAAFVNSRAAGSAPLAQALVGSQMFEQFVVETAPKGLPANSPVARWHAWFLSAEAQRQAEEKSLRAQVAAIDCNTPAEKSLREGWMRRYTHKGTGETLRYFVLSAGGLMCYGSENVSKGAKGSIPLPPGTQVVLTKLDAGRLALEIRTPELTILLEPVTDEACSASSSGDDRPDPRSFQSGLESLKVWCALLSAFVEYQPVPRAASHEPSAGLDSAFEGSPAKKSSSFGAGSPSAENSPIRFALPGLPRDRVPIIRPQLTHAVSGDQESPKKKKSNRPSSTKGSMLILKSSSKTEKPAAAAAKAGLVTPQDLSEAKALFAKEIAMVAAKPRSAAKEALGQYPQKPARPAAFAPTPSSAAAARPVPLLATATHRSMQTMPSYMHGSMIRAPPAGTSKLALQTSAPQLPTDKPERPAERPLPVFLPRGRDQVRPQDRVKRSTVDVQSLMRSTKPTTGASSSLGSPVKPAIAHPPVSAPVVGAGAGATPRQLPPLPGTPPRPAAAIYVQSHVLPPAKPTRPASAGMVPGRASPRPLPAVPK